MANAPHGGLCPRFHKAVELIGSRWTGAVIQLLLKGPARFSELREAVQDISDRMLSDRLRVLEEEGIVERIVFPETPVRVEYRLTAKGKALEPALGAIGKWAEKFVEPVPDSRAAVPAKRGPQRGSRAGDPERARR